jgi:hypothetical protein
LDHQYDNAYRVHLADDLVPSMGIRDPMATMVNQRAQRLRKYSAAPSVAINTAYPNAVTAKVVCFDTVNVDSKAIA